MLAPGITYDAVESGYIFGASTCGQAALYQLGLTGIPITNVNNNCATGSTAVFQAAILVRACEARCGLAPGWHPVPSELERTMPGVIAPVPLPLFVQAAARASPDADPRCPCRAYLGLLLRSILGCMGAVWNVWLRWVNFWNLYLNVVCGVVVL
jgi:hypothetical protein